MQLPWSTLNYDPTAVGCTYPPHQTMGANYDFAACNSVHKIPRERLADFQPDFNTVIFEPRAKHLDLIASAPIPHYGWLISDRFQKLLSAFALPTHRIYSLPVTQRGRTIEGYSWLHLPQPRLILSEAMSIKDAEHAIASNAAMDELDVVPIYSPVRFGYFFVSRTLRQAIENAGLTGIRFGVSKLFRGISQNVAEHAIEPKLNLP